MVYRVKIPVHPTASLPRELRAEHQFEELAEEPWAGGDQGKTTTDHQCWTRMMNSSGPTSVTFRGGQPEMALGEREQEE